MNKYTVSPAGASFYIMLGSASIAGRNCGEPSAEKNIRKLAAQANAAPELLAALHAVTLHFSSLPLMDADREVLALAFSALRKAEA